MKRVMAVFAALVLGIVLLALGLYAGFIHPNDARMNSSHEERGLPPEKAFRRVGSVLGDGYFHQLDVDMIRFGREEERVRKAMPDNVLTASTRFVSLYQIYLPVGKYPLRLDAEDALFIPDGATLTVRPHLSGDFEVRFGVNALGTTGRVRMANQGREVGLFEGKARTKVPDTESSWYKNVGRFLEVDPLDRLADWRAEKLAVKLSLDDALTFHCENAPLGCALGDVTFYASTAEKARNVMIVLIDTLRGDAIGAGNAPRLRALADESVVFDQALAAGNMTSPSTNAFLSCRLPSQLGQVAFSYGVSPDSREQYYKRKQPSFPARFQKQHFDTAMIGNVSVISEIYGVGVNHGFSRQISIETDGYDTPAIARDAVRWLKANGDHPFFLYLHFNGPHAPYRAPFVDLFRTFPGIHALSSYSNTLLWLYQSEVAYTDRYFGTVLDAMRDLDLEKNTVLVVTADHGDQHKSHVFADNQAAPAFTGAYFDHGATLLNDEIHVPLMIRGAGLAPHHVQDFVSTLDTGPTLLDLFGVGGAENCAGTSLRPYLASSTVELLKHRTLGSEGFQGRAVLFDDRYKYIRLYEPTDKRVYGAHGWGGERRLYFVPKQLYDLQVDPKEEHDLSTSRPELRQRAEEIYKTFYAIHDSYELVVEDPGAGMVDATIWTDGTVRMEEGEAAVVPGSLGHSVTLTAAGRKRYLIEIKGSLSASPVVRMGGQVVPLESTTMRLPFSIAPDKLPVEVGGRFTLLEAEARPAAYLRRVEDDGQQNRRILGGNPAFEKVLREWGYLNDK